MTHLSKIYLAILPLLFDICETYCQQSPSWSSFYENGFVWNPALTGRWNTWEASTTYRRDWVGFDGGPETGTIGFQYPFVRQFTKVSIGAYLEYDRAGPIENVGGAATYCYKIRPRLFGKKDDVLTFGIKAGAYKTQFDPNRLTFFNKPEGNIDNLPFQTKVLPDFGAGIYYVSVSDFYSFKSHYYAGLSTSRFLPLQYYMVSNSSVATSMNIHIHGGYRYFPFRSSTYFEPSLFINYSVSKGFHAMAHVRWEMVDKLWLATGIASSADAFAQAGVILGPKTFMKPIVRDGTLRLGVKSNYTLSKLGREGGIGYEFYMAYLFSNEPY
jgi:type IX secretion system PorP/SprF family membrane protein